MRRSALAVLVLVSACFNGSEPWPERDVSKLTPAEAARFERAKKAASLLGERLFARLSFEIADGGLAAAVTVCRTAAPQIAAEVGAELGLCVGRTSARLRNPDNGPVNWMPGLLLDDRPRVCVSDEGVMGVLLPIRLKAMCTACHGAPEAIDPAVREQLAALYPFDRATGYAEGDLRGFFWVRLPPED